ncbi:MAG: hypothetical protein ACE5KP_01595 [Dehalococcoidales bacterium]
MVFQQNNRPAEGKLSYKLAELLSIENDISNIMRRTENLRGKPLTSVRDLIRDALHKAYEIALDFGPNEMSVEAGIGVPPRVTISFTWPLAKPAEAESEWYDELLR